MKNEFYTYKVVHAKKGLLEVQSDTIYGAAKKAAQIWKLKSTAGIDAHLANSNNFMFS
jgi:hypothetical protein